MQTIDFTKATRVYVGLDHHCRCGCGGNYHEVGSRGFKMAISRAKKLVADEVSENYVNFPTSKTRAITVYFN